MNEGIEKEKPFPDRELFLSAMEELFYDGFAHRVNGDTLNAYGIMDISGVGFSTNVSVRNREYVDSDANLAHSYIVKIQVGDYAENIILAMQWNHEPMTENQVDDIGCKIVKTSYLDHVPEGAGISLYKAGLQFIAALAEGTKNGIRHTVVHNDDDFNKDLSRERWKEIFEPVLFAAGYRVFNEDDELYVLQKTYNPKATI